jgi:hypothetical protein
MDRMLLPVGRPASAIAAGYLALFSILPLVGLIPAILAVACGATALKAIRLDPELSGKGRAWFGILFGGTTSVLTILFIVFMVFQVIVEADR